MPSLALLLIQLLVSINDVDSYWSQHASHGLLIREVTLPPFFSLPSSSSIVFRLKEIYLPLESSTRLQAKVTIKSFNATEFNHKMLGCSSENILVQLEKITSRITKLSRVKFSNGLTDSANPKSQMGTKRDRDGDIPTTTVVTQSSDTC